MNKGEVLRKLRSALILIFSSVWLIALIAGWLIPKFGGQEGAAGKTINGIRWSTGTWQQWDMFQTIPSLRSYQIELVGETSNGEEKTYGAILPDLEAYDGSRAIRYYYAINRIIEHQDFLEGYIAQSSKALRGANPELGQFSIRILSEPTRDLDRIREDGKLWMTVPMELGPYPLNDE